MMTRTQNRMISQLTIFESEHLFKSIPFGFNASSDYVMLIGGKLAFERVNS